MASEVDTQAADLARDVSLAEGRSDDEAYDVAVKAIAEALRSAAEAPIRRVLEKVETRMQSYLGNAAAAETEARLIDWRQWRDRRGELALVREILLAELTPEGRTGG